LGEFHSVSDDIIQCPDEEALFSSDAIGCFMKMVRLDGQSFAGRCFTIISYTPVHHQVEVYGGRLYLESV
jgi:hypothetical protein